MKTSELKFDRNLVPELSKGNIAYPILKEQILPYYTKINPVIVKVENLNDFEKNENQIKIPFPSDDLYWLHKENENAKEILVFLKGSSALFSEPNEWDFYSLNEDIELTAVVGSFYDAYLGECIGTDLYICLKKMK